MPFALSFFWALPQAGVRIVTETDVEKETVRFGCAGAQCKTKRP